MALGTNSTSQGPPLVVPVPFALQLNLSFLPTGELDPTHSTATQSCSVDGCGP
jgi:hypothetical protein